jgi:hypothetical protein
MERLSSARRDSERGDVVLSWLTKLVVFFALAGVVLFDAISVGTTYSSVADQGSYAAHQASESWDETKDLQKAYLTASSVAADANSLNVVDPKSFRIDPDGTVHLKISRTATTVVLYRIGPLKHLAQVEHESKSRSVT